MTARLTGGSPNFITQTFGTDEGYRNVRQCVVDDVEALSLSSAAPESSTWAMDSSASASWPIGGSRTERRFAPPELPPVCQAP